MVDLNKLAKKTLENAMLRQKNGAHINCDTYHMLKHCATEVIEAQQAFDEWQEDLKFGPISMGVTDPDWTKITPKDQFASELADIVCCCLIIAGHTNIDIEKAVLDCIEKNRKRAEGVGDKK